MANLKFFKGTFGDAQVYVDGGIYFDNTKHEIRVGNGGTGTAGYAAFGSNIRSVEMVKGAYDEGTEKNKLVISFYSGSNIEIDLSDVASASAVGARLTALETTVGNSTSGLVHDVTDLQSRMTTAENDIDAVETRMTTAEGNISTLQTTVAGKVGSVTSGNNGITIGGTATAPTVAVRVSEEEGQSLVVKDDGLYVSAPAGDAYSMAKKDTAEEGYAATYYLTKNGVQEGVSINIAKDQVVDKADVIDYNGTDTQITVDGKTVTVKGTHAAGKYIVMLMQNSESQVWINVEDLLNYQAGTAIKIENATISVKVADATTNNVDAKATNKNFLKVVDDKLLVKGVDADATVTVEDVEVVGGPLADAIDEDAWPSDWVKSGKRIVPENITMQDFIKKLFLKEINGTLGDVVYTWNPVNAAPTASIGVSGNVEVGTTVTMTIAANNTVTGNTHKADVDANGEGMYGYFDTTAHKDVDYVQSVDCSTSGTASYAAEWRTSDGNIDNVVNGDTKNVKVGANTLAVSQSGITAVCNILSPLTIYALTNTGSKVDSVSRNITEDIQTDKSLTSSASATCTGVWPVYSNNAAIDGGFVKMTLLNATSFEYNFPTEVGCTSYVSFAYPKTHTLSKVEVYSDEFKKWYDVAIDTTTQISDSDITVAGQLYSKYVHVVANREGAAKWRFTLNKSTSVA